MNLKITEKPASVCLNMIVKNESHIIKDTLTKLCNKIKFDYWVICDTGSTDNTPEIIHEFFKEMNIKGELYHDKWVDFAYNRTLALTRAYKKTDLLLIFDADDEIVGDIVIPTQVLFDEYHLNFGSSQGTSYTRVLLINNSRQFEFLSVIHEFISCKEPNAISTTINGDYYVVSGRSGNRNLDPNKYLNDALILEKAYTEAKQTNNQLYCRYAYYCANSYKDCGKYNDAIKWYKIVLSNNEQWSQEKYTACLYIYDCYSALNDAESGFFYLVKSFQYDSERVECLYHLLVHYCCEGMNNVAYNYYLTIKDFFETKYLQTDMSKKLFINIDKYNFFLPYYMILIADKVQDFKCVIRMYEIVFIKKQKMFEEWYINNFLYNLQFFLNHVETTNTNFIMLANDYVKFLYDNNVKLHNCEFLNKDVYKNAGLKLDYIFTEPLTNKHNKFSKEICQNSTNILIYTGFSDIKWNYSYMLNNALGGSEKAVAYISQLFPKNYNIFISGDVKNETIDNVHYIPMNELTNLIQEIPFHTVIVSRYISFYELFKECSFYQSFIWAHDVRLLPYGCHLNENQILKKWNNYINGCICLTEWHKKNFIDRYPEIEYKIHLINNGIDLDSFKATNKENKIKNKFIYSSRPDRGLKTLLNLWPNILEQIPDATLTISSYGNFPSNSEEEQMQIIINKYPTSIKHLGKLNSNTLYEEMSSAEYWLYPTDWPETSCITALEMLMSGVICLYYPVAGLTNTMETYGIQVSSGNEINNIVSLTEELKYKLREQGKQYAESCSWVNRSNIWCKILNINKNITSLINNNQNIAIFNSFPFHYEMFGYIISFCKENNHKLTIFTNEETNLGWLEFYKTLFNDYEFNYKSIDLYEKEKEMFDITFITTDDDRMFKKEWITSKCIVIDHYCKNRKPEYFNHLGTRPFIGNYNDSAIPCYKIVNTIKNKTLDNNIINIAIIGVNNDYNYDTINKLTSDSIINLHIVSRGLYLFDSSKITNNIISFTYYNLEATLLIELLKKCDYVLSDTTYNTDHIYGLSMSGSIPLAISTLTPLIITNVNNSLYKFKSAVEFNLNTSDRIILKKGIIDYNLLIEERDQHINNLKNYIEKTIINNNICWFNYDDNICINLPHNINNLKSIYKNYHERAFSEPMFRSLVTYLFDKFENKNIIDLGAYIGDNCIPWAIKSKGTIYAIDPCKENIDFINLLASLNNIENIITIENTISDTIEDVYTNDDLSHICCNTHSGIHKLRTTTLDLLDLNNIGFIHLDVEGFEQKVLNGSINLISKNNPIISWENHILSDDFNYTVNFLKKLGYDSYMINEILPGCLPDCRNFISFKENTVSIHDINIHFNSKYKIHSADKNREFLIKICNSIPKKIIQTWEHKDLNPDFQEIVDNWKINNPNYEYNFFDKNERQKFIEDNFEQDVINVYNYIIPGAYKVDLFRYCYLYICGGVYIDIDSLCIGKLDDFLLSNIDLIVPIDLNTNPYEGKYNLACGFIASIPNHPVLLDCINRIVYNVEHKIIPSSKLDFSGPGILGKSVNKYLQNHETESFVGKEGIQNNIYFLKFESGIEYVKDNKSGNILFQNKNGNKLIQQLYNVECNKLSNYVDWVNCVPGSIIHKPININICDN